MLITNFSSGELSKKLSGRVDIQQYYQGVSKLSNFEIIPTGGITRRPGTKRLAKLHGQCRLIPFIIDKDNSFILEFRPRKIYIWKNGSPVINATTRAQLYLTTEYSTMAEINEIHYAQDYDTMIFCHSGYKPVMLEYNYATELFSCGAMSFDLYPDVELDDDYNYVVIAGETLPERVQRADGQLAFKDKDNNIIVTGDKGYCVFNGKLYEYNKTLSTWEQTGSDPETDEDLFNAAGKYPGCVTFFNNRLWLASTISARQKVWASCTPDTNKTRYNDFSTFKKYVTVNKVVKDADLHVFTADLKTAQIDTTNNRTTLVNVTQNFTTAGVLKEDANKYFCTNSDYVPVGTKVVSVTATTVVLDKALDIDEDVDAVVFTIQLWRNSNAASADDYEYQITESNMTTSDCSFNFELASDQNDAIRFIGANKYLTIGTESSVWNVPNSVTALNVLTEMSGRYGSDTIQGHAVGNAMIFFAQGKQGIRECYWDNSAEAFQTNNIAILAEQMLTESAAVDFDFVTNPYNRIIITREDGIIISMLYDKTNGIMGWNRFCHGEGKIISVAVTRGSEQSDLIYMAVEDDLEYYLEIYDENKKVYLDSYQETTGDFSDYTENAVLLCEGKILATSEYSTVSNKTVYVGYQYESLLSSLPVVQNDPTSKKRITNLLVRFLESSMPVIVCDNTEEYFTDVETPYSGIKSVDFAGSSERDVSFTLKTSDPEACTILSVNANLA